MLCLIKRATSLKKSKVKKKIVYPDKTAIKKIGVFFIKQLGYKCDKSVCTKNINGKRRIYLYFSIISALISFTSVIDADIPGFICTLLGTVVLFLECLLEHEDILEEKGLIVNGDDGVPLEDVLCVKTPITAKMFFYMILSFFGFSLFVLTGFQSKVINFTILSIEALDVIFTGLVVVFDADAEAVVD